MMATYLPMSVWMYYRLFHKKIRIQITLRIYGSCRLECFLSKTSQRHSKMDSAKDSEINLETHQEEVYERIGLENMSLRCSLSLSL